MNYVLYIIEINLDLALQHSNHQAHGRGHRGLSKPQKTGMSYLVEIVTDS